MTHSDHVVFNNHKLEKYILFNLLKRDTKVKKYKKITYRHSKCNSSTFNAMSNIKLQFSFFKIQQELLQAQFKLDWVINTN